MEQKHISDTSSSNYPWLVAQNLEPEDNTGEQIFYTVHDPMMSHYRCRIPELAGRHIQACFHGWVILSNHPHDIEWSLWNPVTSKFIRLPPLILKDGDSDRIRHCCLSSPPDDRASILMLMRSTKPNIVFCRLDNTRKRLRWTEMSYSKQLRNITNDLDSFLLEPTCCNGKVYAWTNYSSWTVHIIQIRIVVKKVKVVISLLPFVNLPFLYPNGIRAGLAFKGSCPELFIIIIGVTKENPVDVRFYKLDTTTSMCMWTRVKELKDTVLFADLFVDLPGVSSVYCSPAIASKLGGYIHFLHKKKGKVIYSYNVEDKTISLSCMHWLDLPPRSETRPISIWPMREFGLQGGDDKCKDEDSKQDVVVNGDLDQMVISSALNDDETDETRLLNIPFDVLEVIMEFCVGIEYLNFRATCKRCRLAAPMIQWSNERRRLATYSLVSPWLVVLDEDRGIITFTDPMFGGDKYFIKAFPGLFCNDRSIFCSRYGWLLLLIDDDCLSFYNPFTSEIHRLPRVDTSWTSFCFSAPPTSPDCMVVGFASSGHWDVFIHLVGGEPSWRRIKLDFVGGDRHFFGFPTFCGRDVYALFKYGGLGVFKSINDPEKFSWEMVVDEVVSPTSSSLTEYFRAQCDQHLLQVMVGEFGESVEVFKLNDCTKEWKKIDDLGRHMIFICDTTCVCMDAKTPEMENKIYFPRLHCDNGNIVFYSLETRMYHTFNGRNVEQNLRDLFGTKRHTYSHAWIQPTWL